ncbi:RDD family protein [Marinomonas sp. 5E14-1]|uniref:RDD family protein n=1 Tax=Marinomonas sp. 5E14-1 TaxID=3153922 RepID=UPI00326533D3
MTFSHDYSKYTIEQLSDMRKNINEEKYPEKAEEIASALAKRMEAPEIQAMLEKEKKIAKEKKRDLKYSTFWPRFWAATIDGILFAIILYIECFVLGVEFNVHNQFIQTFNAIQFSIYVIFMHGYFGQTLGKRIMKVKVLDHGTETRINLKQALRRESVNLTLNIFWLFILLLFVLEIPILGSAYNLLYIVLIFSVLSSIWGISEFVTMLFNDKRRALHDLIGKTVVVRMQ